MAVIPAIDLDQGDAPASIGYAPLGGMTIDAAGRVTYNFDGHIHAAGIDIDAAAAGTPSNDHRIHWLRPDGTVAAEILGFETTPAGSDHLGLEAGPDTGGYTAQLGLDTFTGSSFVSAQAYPGPSVTVIDHLGRSSFLRLSPSQNLQAAIGVQTFIAVAAGGSFVNAAVPWANNHTGAAILHVVPAASYGFVILPRVNAVNQLLFAISNNPVVQDITVNWLTFGN